MKKGTSYFKGHKIIILFFVEFLKYSPKILKDFIWNCSLNHEGLISLGLRYCILASRVKKCGDNVFIGRGVVIKNMEKLTLGSNISIHAMCYIDAFGGIQIGDNVSIAHQTSLISFEHTWSNHSLPIKYNKTIGLGIKIFDDVWVGCGVRVLDGAIIGRRSVIAAGAVVKGNTKKNFVHGGIPARPIKEIK